MPENEVTEGQLLQQMVQTETELQNAQIAVVRALNQITTKEAAISASNAAAPVPKWDGTQLKFVKGNDPNTDLCSYVDLKGETGATGPQGPSGENGEDGVSPSVNMTYFSAADHKSAGVLVVITDSKGEKSARVYNAELSLDTDPNTGQVTLTARDGNGTTTANISQGAAGSDGVDGVSPTVTSTAIEGGTRVTVTDVNGTQTFDVMDGVDGANGTNGQDGATPAFEVGNVTTAERGEDPAVTLTLKTGTDADYTMDFKLPAGGSAANLLSATSISGDSSVAIGHSKTYTFTASCLLTGAQVDHFTVTFGDTSYNVSATNGSGTLTLTVPAGTADGSVLEIKAVAYDDYGNSGLEGTKTITAVAASVSQPTVTVSANEIYPDAALTLTGSAFSATGITGSHTKTDWALFNSSDTSGTPVWSSANDSANKTSKAIPAGTLTPGTRYASCRYHDATLGWSDWAEPVAVTVKQPIVNAPVIQSPSSGASIVKASGLDVTLGSMSVTGGSDTQASATVTICSDSAGNNVAKSKTVTGTGLTVAFTSADLNSLTAGSNYYIFAKRTGVNYGESAKSSGVRVTFTNGITERGCLLYRSANGIATTIEAVGPDGTTPIKFEVIDAAYRKDSLKFGAYNQDNPDLQFFASKNTNNTWYIDGGSAAIDKATALPASITMSSLVSLWGSTLTGLESAQVANASWHTRYKDQTDSQSIKGVPAVEYCRGLTNDGGGWLLPTIWELMITYMLSDKLDEMDPTAAANPSLKLGYTATSGRFYFGTSYAWSCTEFSATACRRVYSNGNVNANLRNGAFAAVPVRELS